MRPIQLLTILEQKFISTRAGHHTPIMLWGAPGVGKSDMVQEVALTHNSLVIDIRLSHKRVFDLVKDFGTSQSSKIDSIFRQPIVPRPSCVPHDSLLHFHSKLLVHYFIMTTAMTLRRLGCAL